MEHLQYARRQYSIKQYGRYEADSDEDGEGPIIGSNKTFLGKSRIQVVMKNKEKSKWVQEHTPIKINKKTNKVRLTTNLGERITSRRESIDGYHSLIRLRTNKETIVSKEL